MKRSGTPKRRSLFVRLIQLVVTLFLLGVLGLVGVFVYYGHDLPSTGAMLHYQPTQMSKVYDRSGKLVGEYFVERRTVLPAEKIPAIVKKAIVASEDADFYEHPGVDIKGLTRAVLKGLLNRHATQGGSTITQQLVKNMVLSPERSVARKVKEAILAFQIEQNLSKDQILALYLNQINFGHARYGIEEAAQFYFKKPAEKLTLGEAALLVGIPQSPSNLSPLIRPDRAKARQVYVLNQMAEKGMVTPAQAQAEIDKPLALPAQHEEAVGAYYVEEARRQLIDKFGEDLVTKGGLRIELAMDSDVQRMAEGSVRAGLEELDHRMGFTAPKLSVTTEQREALRTQIFVSGKAGKGQVWGFDRVDANAIANPKVLAEDVVLRPLAERQAVVAPVSAVTKDAVIVDLGSIQGTIPWAQLKWARPFSPAKATPAPKKPSDVLALGNLVRVRIVGIQGSQVSLVLAPVPSVQGALVSIDPATRQVLAMVGGYDFAQSSFNRATQAKRQPGSSFKPFVYGAALETRKITPASIFTDAPEVQRDPWTGKVWKPQNFEKNVFEGPMTIREALTRSKNTISVRLIEQVGPDAVIDFAQRAGITSKLPSNLSLALGTGEVSPLEMANGYTTLNDKGRRAPPILIARVLDSAGKVLLESKVEAEETITPQISFLMTSLMRSVVERGTAQGAKALQRPVVGKTGTTSDQKDAWFSGYAPNLTTTVWVGFDDPAPMGRAETGAHAALPIWIAFMKQALETKPRTEFTMPEGIVTASIDRASGLLAPQGMAGQSEYFLDGTAPTEYAVSPDEVDPNRFMEDAPEPAPSPGGEGGGEADPDPMMVPN